ncbi:MAG: nucleotidyl transferase AbiEii/AbiGii toxin family protein [Myxococcales bacterium]|nr:nucleotidyl transferase AbiEii/AbiGii toxin family protein [Myxococcales bacterium]
MKRLSPLDVMPPRVTAAVQDQTYWFVISGQAVRCFAPYRPSRDVDFGVLRAKDKKELVAQLRERGQVELIERDRDTVHLTFEGIDVSIFVLRRLAAHVEDRSLDVTGVLATKTHALLDRGLRRDFFDLYVMLQMGSLGLLDCLAALREVYDTASSGSS